MSAYNGSGTFVVSGVGLPFVTGTTISSTVANTLNTDLATGLSTAICKDGQTTVTANIPMGGFKLTGIAVATATGDALSYGRTASVTTLVASSAVSAGGGNSNILPGASATINASSSNFSLGLIAVLSGYLCFASWNSGLGYALIFIDATGSITTISSSNSTGGNSAFDTTNNFSSNGGNGIAIIFSGGTVYVQTKSGYSGPTPFRLAQFG